MEVRLDVLREACLPFVKKTVMCNGGSAEDARDIFSEALLVYLTKGKSYPKAIPAVYVCAVARRLWMKELRRRRTAAKHRFRLLWHEEQNLPERSFREEEEVLCAFENLPESRAKQILTAFYMEKMSMSEIARRFGFASENAAKKQKFRAVRRLRACLQQALPHAFQAA